MKSRILFLSFVLGAILITLTTIPAYAACQPGGGAPSGTVTYNGSDIRVTYGQFVLGDTFGTVDGNGYVTYGDFQGCLLEIPGVSGYKVDGAAAVSFGPSNPSGTVTYYGQKITVTNGVFTLNGKTGTIDAQGNVVYDGQAMQLQSIPGVTGYQIAGQAAVTFTPGTSNPVITSVSGIVFYSGQVIIVTNGTFTLNGKSGTIDAQGKVFYDGQTMQLQSIPGVTGYQIIGQAAVYFNSATTNPVTTNLSGTVTYNGQKITVTNGVFTLNGKTGTIDAQGNVVYDGQYMQIQSIPGVTGYQIAGQAAVYFNTTNPSGTVTYNGQKIIITNGTFTLNGKSGTIDAQGKVVYNGQSMQLQSIPGVTGYQIAGQAAVYFPPNGTVTYNGKKITVTNGVFTLNGKSGTIDAQGNVVYNGQYMQLQSIPGVTGYQIAGQAAVSFTTTGGDADFKTWADKRGGMNANRGANWQEFSDSVSQSQVNAWIRAHSNLTPSEIFKNMQTYKIQFLTIAGAKTAATTGGYANANTLRDFNLATPPVTTKMMYDAGLIALDSNRGHGTAGVYNGDNVYWAAAAGWLPISVMYADRYGIPPVSGKTTDQVYFSQKDLDVAKGYRSSGYWGPYESGDMDIEFTKAGLVSGDGLNRRYTFSYWNNAEESGPNIADPALYRYVPGTTTIPPTTRATSTTTIAPNTLDDDSTVTDTSSSCLNIPVRIQYLSRDGSTTNYVSLLQDFLLRNDYLTTEATGFFGFKTVLAVRAFQKDRGLTQTGALGPLTRAAIKTATCSGPRSTTSRGPTNAPLAQGVIPSVLGVSTACVALTSNFHRGAENNNVKALQSFLSGIGLLDHEATGFYGDKTVAAVKEYQASRNLASTGMVFEFTRDAIKKESCF